VRAGGAPAPAAGTRREGRAMTKRTDAPFSKPIYMVAGDPSSPVRAVVSFGCLFDEMTLREHQEFIKTKNGRLLDREEATRIHGVDEADRYFGRRGDA